MPNVSPWRTTGDTAGAELRAWLLAEETELYEDIMKPPPPGIDGRPPAKVDPALNDALDMAMGGRMRDLAARAVNTGWIGGTCRRSIRCDVLAR